MKTKLLLFLVLFAALGGSAFGQGFRFDNQVSQELLTTAVPGATNLLTVPANPQIAFCNSPANAVPCTNKATTYTSVTLGTPCSTSTQMVLVGTTSCVASPDAQGNWGVWVPNGQYAYTITLPGGVNLGPYNITLGISAGTSLSIAGLTTTGPNSLGGSTTIPNPCAIEGALIFVSSGGCYTTFAAAFAACPSTNCVIDGRAAPSILSLGTFDPGATFPVTLYLGPYTYSVAQIVLRPGFHLYGTSAGVGLGGSPPATVLQSSSTTTPVFVLGGTIVNDTHIEGLRVYCGAGNAAQIGFNIIAPVGGGHWYSDYKDMYVGGDGTHECAGGAILYDGNAGAGTGNAINQWIAFRDVRAFRTTNGAPALKITGLNGQFSMDNSEFDGPTPRDNNKVNILINDGTETFRAPYNFAFSNVTSQLAWGATGVAIQLAGVNAFSCLNCHFENDNGGIKATTGTTFGTWGTLVKSSHFDTGTGIDGGNGFILSTDINSSIAFEDNDVAGTPDTMFAGTSTKFVSSKGNINQISGVAQPAPANNRPIGGFDNNSPALKHLRVTTGSVGAGTRINTTVTWTTAFPDANYTPVCTVIDSTTANTAAGLVLERGNAIQAAATFNVTIFNPTGGAITGQLDCIAIHD